MKKKSIFKKWWFWVFIVPLSICIIVLLFNLNIINTLFPKSCQTWLNNINEPAVAGNIVSNCEQSYVCVPKDCDRNKGECSGSFLASGHSISNPAQGICRKGLSFPF